VSLGARRFLLVCDHASNFIPEQLHQLGLPAADLRRHIAYDIGAAGITEALSEMLDAPAVLSTTSRLVVDCNRQLSAPDLIPASSDQTLIPGNQKLSSAARAGRISNWFRPYHDAIEAAIQLYRPSAIVSIHSMTPSLGGVARPWQIALSSGQDRRLTEPVLESLRRPGDIIVGDNEPYDLDPAVDYTVPVHAIQRGLPYLQVEFRQDLVVTPDAQRFWALRFARAIEESKYFEPAAK
jgi:predicted N-formylglutamate amidohydrolase